MMHVKNDRHAGEDMSLIISSVPFFFLSSFCLYDFLLANFTVTVYLWCVFLSYFFFFVVLTRETMSGKEWYTPLSVMLLFVSLRVQVKPPSAMIRSWDHLFCKPVVAFIFRLRDLFPFSSQGLQQRKRRSEHIEDAILLLVLSSPLLSCSDLCDKKQFSE